MSSRQQNRYTPLWLAISAVVGIFIGTFYANHFAGNRLSIINAGGGKLQDLLHIVNDQYVDTVDMAQLVEKAMPQILSELDPHSVYLSSEDRQMADEDLRGSFSGVGIEFVIRDDTVRVQNVISNGPAERAGVLAGDKIVSVDDSAFVGPKVTSTEAVHRLKGPKDTKVKVGVKRHGEPKTIEFTITRGDIPMHSVSAAFMLDDQTGFIRIKNFGENTYPELLISLAQLAGQGFQKLIIDLRGNTGGYLGSAVQIANEFLPKNQIIVYTEGRHSQRQDYLSDGKGSYQTLPLAILIDEGSASASEILAGAMQDNDRAAIVGRRSFGKGLVQQPIEFNDGSLVRLTIARYYTPAGRCIQKPYQPGQGQDYDDDLMNRYERGEFFSQDSIHQNGPAYKTRKGRTVYGGGGIMPDVFVPQDTANYTSYFKEANMTGLLLQYAYDYTDANRQKLQQFGRAAEIAEWLKRQGIVEHFATWAEKKNLKRRNLMIRQSYHLLEQNLTGRIIYNMLGEQAYLEYSCTFDQTVSQASATLAHTD